MLTADEDWPDEDWPDEDWPVDIEIKWVSLA